MEANAARSSPAPADGTPGAAAPAGVFANSRASAAGGAAQRFPWREIGLIGLVGGGLWLLMRAREANEARQSERDELMEWGRIYPHPENPPAWVADESIWERAKAAVRPNWESYREPWAVVAHAYDQMGGRRA